MTCNTSEFHGRILTNNNVNLAGDTDLLTFKECTPCAKVIVEALPYGSEIRVDAADNYTWVTPFVVTMSECFAKAKCKFEGGMEIDIDNFNGKHLFLAIKEKLLLGEGFEELCGEATHFDATYLVKTNLLNFWLSLKALP